MNKRINRLMTEARKTFEHIEAAAQAGVDPDHLQQLSWPFDQATKNLCEAIKDLMDRPHDAHFKRAERLAEEGWFKSEKRKSRTYLGTLHYRDQHEYIVAPAFTKQEVALIAVGNAPTPPWGTFLMLWKDFQHLINLTEELELGQIQQPVA